ncbi:MAG: hypothetical protein ABR511_04565 [Acidimicrobiales bacterium]
MSAGPAFGDGNGAVTVPCSDVSPDLGGTVVFTPDGQLLGNCFEHQQSPGGGSTGGSAQIVSCDEALAPGTVGIQVTTPEGSTYTNCHVHVNGGQP